MPPHLAAAASSAAHPQAASSLALHSHTAVSCHLAVANATLPRPVAAGNVGIGGNVGAPSCRSECECPEVRRCPSTVASLLHAAAPPQSHSRVPRQRLKGIAAAPNARMPLSPHYMAASRRHLCRIIRPHPAAAPSAAAPPPRPRSTSAPAAARCILQVVGSFKIDDLT